MSNYAELDSDSIHAWLDGYVTSLQAGTAVRKADRRKAQALQIEIARRVATPKLAALVEEFFTGKISKFDFYSATKNYKLQAISDAAGISVDVIKDRRRYLRQIAVTAA